MPQPYYPPVDPGGGQQNGLQQGSTAASALGFVALVGSQAGDSLSAALGLGSHAPHFLTAGISLASLGHLNLFSIGLGLVGLGIILNVISLGLASRQRSQELAEAAACADKTAGPNDPATAPNPNRQPPNPQS
ncbi:MAG TPA: hypothetical protein VF173_31145 [Thermoanaerobaculia bacterium]|nr:hypothetical protein [Thermoanaerobaculia bacterium]